MKKTISSGALPEIAQAIDRAYGLAFSLVSRLRFAESFATQAADLTAVAFFEGEDEEQRIAESVAHAKGKLFDRRSELIELRELIVSDLEELREAFVGTVIEVFEFAFAELGDDEAIGDRSAYAAITKLSYAVRKWISETLGFLSLAESLPVNLDLSLRQKCNDLADGFPMNQNFERAIRKRLLFEKSILTRNAKAYAETRGIIKPTTGSRTFVDIRKALNQIEKSNETIFDGIREEIKNVFESATTPQGRKKTEKTKEQLKREKSFLDLLSEYEKWQVAQTKKTGRKRFSPDDWLKVQDLWSTKSKTFFRSLCGKDLTGSEIVTRAIKYARKLSRKQASGD